MTEEIDLKQIERKAYTSFHQDGVIDLMIGIWLIWFIVCMAIELLWLGGIILPTLLFVYIGAKQKLTIPRIGYVKFGARGKTRMYVILGVFMCLAVTGLLFALMFADSSIRDKLILILESYYNLIIAGVAGGLTLLMAVGSGIKRFFIYAALILGLFVSAQVFGINLLYTCLTIAISFIVLGTYTLVQFLRENPLPEEGV